MAIVFPSVREAGLIAMERGGRKEIEGPSVDRGFLDDDLARPPLGKRNMLIASRKRRKTEKMDASGSLCSSSSTDCRKYLRRSSRPL